MPVEDPKALAQEYLAKHSIGQIFENLQAHVLIDRPENVREYMIEYLTNLKKDEEGQFDPELVPSSLPPIFKEKDIMVRSTIPSEGARLTGGVWLFTLQTMFGQFDVNGSGSISAAQCKSALQNMGIEASEMPEISEPSYTGEAFLALALPAVEKKTAL